MTNWKTIPKKTIIIVLILVLVYTLGGFFGVPALTRKYLPPKLSEVLGRRVEIVDVKFNPYLLSAAVHGFEIKENDGQSKFIGVERFFVRVGVSSLLRLMPVITEVSVEKPVISIVRDKNGGFNFADLAKSGPDETSESEQEKGVLEFILENLNVLDGQVLFDDQQKSASHTITGLTIALPYLTSKEDKRYDNADLDIGFDLNRIGVTINIQTTPFAEDMATRTQVQTQALNLVHYLPYLSLPDGLSLKSLEVKSNVDLLFRQTKESPSLELKGRVDVLNLDLNDDHGQDITGFDGFSVDISESDLFSGELNIEKASLDGLHLNIVRKEDQTLNLMQYTAASPDEPKKTAKSEPNDTGAQTVITGSPEKPKQVDKKDSGGGFKLVVGQFAVNAADIGYKDNSNPTPFETRVSPLNLKLENLEVADAVKLSYLLSLETETGEKISSNGHFLTAPFTMAGDLVLSDLILNKYAPYYQPVLNIDIKDGRSGFSAAFDLSRPDETLEGKIEVSRFFVKSLSVLEQASQDPLFVLPEMEVTNTIVDLGQSMVNTGDIRARDSEIFLKRLKDGQINFATLVKPKTDNNDGRTVNAVDLKGPADQKNTDVDSKKESAWQIILPLLDLSDFKFNFQDMTNPDLVNIDLRNIQIKASDIRTYGDQEGDVSLKLDWNDKGKIDISGSVLPAKVQTDLVVDLDKIDIKSVQPYFTQAVKVVVTDGHLNTNGKLKLDFSPPENPVVQFTGQSSVNQFVALDKKSAKDFFKAKSLHLSGLDVSVFPFDLAIKEVSLTDFYSRIIISDTGELNLNNIFNSSPANNGDVSEKPDQKAPEPKEPEPKEMAQKEPEPPSPTTIKVESITLQGGDVQFSDYQAKPNFTAGMSDLAGSVSGLSSEQGTRADLHLKGIHGQSSPLEIAGEINPLAENKIIDLAISFKDIGLSRFTPYSGKYLGYTIEKGKLLLDLEYLIDGSRLKSENRVRIDNFFLGDSVESEDATSLPVGLAISLLKNKSGQINLDLPVRGELDDPKFSFGGIVLDMITNLIIKVVASPFSMIGSMFEGGENLEYLDFEYGKTQLSEENYTKIDQLTEILIAKPTVKLEIQGLYDHIRDSEYLRIEGFNELIKAEKMKQKMMTGDKATSLKDVVVSEEEEPIYISQAYARAEFPKPKIPSGEEKQISLEEKKKLLMTHVPVTEDDLRLLSLDRGEIVKAYILSKGTIEGERIFILEPIRNENAENDTQSKVKFLLK